MSHPHVLITDYAWPSLDVERSILEPLGATLLVAETGEAEELMHLARQADAILTCWRQIPVAVLEAATRCRVVCRYGIGLDNIPVQRATELGILVANVPGFCVDEVSDHVMALLLASARRLPQYLAATRRGVWSQQLADAGTLSTRSIPRLRGQTLGLIGYGSLARALVPKALGFGLKIIAYTPRLAPDALTPFGRAVNELGVLLREADYISIHVPLTDETRGLIDTSALRQMKPTAILINTSRGAVVDEAALVQALQEGWIAGAALDVLASEPPPPDHPLLSLPNVMVTPHVAFYSVAAIEELARRAAEQVAQVLRGEIPTHLVNRTVLDTPALRLSMSV
jgi:D-3-phosphoglycerate dehydrogenase / 2-oxoglutarate reductase